MADKREYQLIDASNAKPAKPLPAHVPAGANELVMTAQEAFEQLIAKAPNGIRELSFQLFEAALAVAIHGETEVSAELARRARMRGAARRKRYKDETARFWTAHAVKHSALPKSRASRDGKTAFDDVAEQEGISPATAEKRRYRPKPRQ